jgi:hypothetical protein
MPSQLTHTLSSPGPRHAGLVHPTPTTNRARVGRFDDGLRTHPVNNRVGRFDDGMRTHPVNNRVGRFDDGLRTAFVERRVGRFDDGMATPPDLSREHSDGRDDQIATIPSRPNPPRIQANAAHLDHSAGTLVEQ